MSNDVEDLKERDAKKAREAYQNWRSDGSNWSAGAAVEGVLWTFTALAIIGMVASMPWVGDAKPIAGTTWIGLSAGGITLFAGGAMVTRYIREDIDTAAVDKKVESRFTGRR